MSTRRQRARAARWRWAKTHPRQAWTAIWPPLAALAATVFAVTMNLVFPSRGIWLAISLAGCLTTLVILPATAWLNGYTHGYTAGCRAGARYGRCDQRIRNSLAVIADIDKQIAELAERTQNQIDDAWDNAVRRCQELNGE